MLQTISEEGRLTSTELRQFWKSFNNLLLDSFNILI